MTDILTKISIGVKTIEVDDDTFINLVHVTDESVHVDFVDVLEFIPTGLSMHSGLQNIWITEV